MYAALNPFDSQEFSGQLYRTLGKVYLQAASVGEVLAVAQTITDLDGESWHAAWNALGERLAAAAEDCLAAGQRDSARALFLRAAEAYRQATFFLRDDLDAPALQHGWRRAVAAFRQAAQLMPHAVEAIRIPFEGRYLHGYAMRPAGAKGQLPTIISPSGNDGTAEEQAIAIGFPALARGYGVIAFDGPGQGNTLFDPETRAFMRPDYDVVLRAVVDYALSVPGIDADRLVGLGWSFGGYLMPRGASGEQRLAALIADPGQYDIGAALSGALPPALAARIEEDSAEAEAAFEALLQRPSGRYLFRPRMAAHGKATVQAYVRHLREFTCAGRAAAITCPALICDNEVDRTSTGQGGMLAEAMTGRVEFCRFTLAEGAGGHCEGMGREVFDQRAFDWLARTFGHKV